MIVANKQLVKDENSEWDVKIGDKIEQLGETQKYSNISGVGLELIVGKYYSDDKKNLTPTQKSQKAVYDAFYDMKIGGTQEIFSIIEDARFN